MTRIIKIRLLLLVAILLVFGQVVTYDFVDWDDGQHVYLNRNIVEHDFGGLLNHWNPKYPENPQMYCPMVFTVWWTLAHLSDVQSPDLLGATLNPYIFHAANLLVHWLCACVVLEILLRLKIPPWPAAAGALIFAVHPLQTEAVAWISAMKDLLSGLFALLCIWRYIVALDSQGPQRKWNYWASLLFFVAALLSKPSTVVLPAIVGAIDLMFYRRNWKVVLLWTGPWYAFSLVATGIAASLQFHLRGVGGPLWAHPLIALDSLAFYLTKLVVPLWLRFDYGRSPAAVLSDPLHPLYWTWVLPVAAALLIWRTHRTPLVLAGAIFVLAVLPELGLKGFIYQYYTTVADRYIYLSMLGVALAVGWLVSQYPSRKTVVASICVIVFFGSLSFVQARKWIDTDSLYSSLDNTQPIHLTILGQYQDHLAVPYLRRAAQAARIGDSEQESELTAKGIEYMEKAMSFYRESIRLGPNDTHAYDMLARDLVQLNQIPEAIGVVKAWIIVDPKTDIAVPEKPGRLESMLGALYLKNRQFPEAVKALKRSLDEEDDPDVAKMLTTAETLAAQTTRPAPKP
jgi:protein O-mannosyl-transferase